MLSWLGPVRDLLGNLLIKHSFVTFVRPEAAMETKLMWQLLMDHCHKGNLSKLMDLLLLFSAGQQWNSLAGSLFHPDAAKVLDCFVLGTPQQVCPFLMKRVFFFFFKCTIIMFPWTSTSFGTNTGSKSSSFPEQVVTHFEACLVTMSPKVTWCQVSEDKLMCIATVRKGHLPHQQHCCQHDIMQLTELCERLMHKGTSANAAFFCTWKF